MHFPANALTYYIINKFLINENKQVKFGTENSVKKKGSGDKYKLKDRQYTVLLPALYEIGNILFSLLPALYEILNME